MSKRKQKQLLQSLQRLLKLKSTKQSASAAALSLYEIDQEVDLDRLREILMQYRVVEVTSTIATLKEWQAFNELSFVYVLTTFQDSFDAMSVRIDKRLQELENPTPDDETKMITPEAVLSDVMAPVTLLERDQDLKFPALTVVERPSAKINRPTHARLHPAKRLSILEKRWRRWARLFARH